MANGEHEKAPAQLSHIGLDLTEGIVSLFGTRDADLVRFRFFLPPGLQQLLSTDPWLHSSIARLVDVGTVNPDEGSPLLAGESDQSAAFYRSAAVDGTFSMADVGRARSVDQLVSPTPQAKSPTVVLPGKLQTKPQEGRPDRHGKPTAWSHFLAHIEGRDGATLLSTSYHGRTREIALGLDQGDQITAQGYLHLRAATDAETRLSTFSVIHLLQYRGKPHREQSS